MSRTTMSPRSQNRSPSFGQTTRQTWQNNRRPVRNSGRNNFKPGSGRPWLPPDPPKDPPKKPIQPRRGEKPRRTQKKPTRYQQVNQNRRSQRQRRSTQINKPTKPTTTKPTVVRPTTKPLSDGLTNQTGKRIGRRVVQNTGGRAVGKIVKGASVVGKIQNAWDLGTGIGGLGRGLLGIDDINPYGDMPGFGAAELAWDLGDAINNLITNPNSEENIPPNVAQETSETNAEIISSPGSISEGFQYPSPWEPITIRPNSSINPAYANQRIEVLVEYTLTWNQITKSNFGSDLQSVDKRKFKIALIGTDPKAKPSVAGDGYSRTSTGGMMGAGHTQNYQEFGTYIYAQNYTVLEAYRLKISNSEISYVPTADGGRKVSNSSTITAFPWPYNSGDFVRESLTLAAFWVPGDNARMKPEPYNTPMKHSPALNDNRVSTGEGTYKPIFFVFDWFQNSSNIEQADFNTRITGFSYKVLSPEQNSSNSLREIKMSTCKALDAMKAMEQRINALEANLNKKLGEEAIEKIEIETTTIDENGEEIKVKEEIELDGIGGTVAKILQNQYQEKESDNEEILKRLGDPITPETKLPSGETLAAAGIGIGGIGGLALLTHAKLGPQIKKLPTYTNTGTPTNIVPTITEADANGISGGIDKINKEMQENKHEAAKKHKLDLRANLIQLLDLALSIHNAFALSSSLIDTIVSFMNNVFQMFGFKDENDQPIDVREVVGESFENLLKILLGAETADDVIKFFVKTNRIIQTGANVLFDLQGLTDSVRSISQQTGEYVAKIGNALKRNRIVPDDPEDSYGWMDEKMTPRSAFQKRIESISEELQNVTDFMGSLESVTSEVISAQEQFGSLKNNAIEFKNLVTTSEAEKTTAENEKTAESQSPEINPESIKPGE